MKRHIRQTTLVLLTAFLLVAGAFVTMIIGYAQEYYEWLAPPLTITGKYAISRHGGISRPLSKSAFHGSKKTKECQQWQNKGSMTMNTRYRQ